MTDTFRYDSIEAYRTEAMKPAGTKDNAAWLADYPPRVADRYSREWFGPFKRDYHAATAALQGWEAGKAEVQRLASALEVPPPVSTVRRIRRADQGDDLVMEDVYAGRLDTAWRVARRDHRATRSREIWLGNMMGVNGRTNGMHLYWRGAAILALADLLTMAGYSVGILSYVEQVGHDEHRRKTSRIEVVIKDPLAPLDLGALTGALVNPGFYRVLYWNWCASRPYNLHEGLGSPKHYHIPGIIQGTETICYEHTARAYILKTIKELEGGSNEQAA